MDEIVTCDDCGQKLRLPIKKNIAFYICPNCRKRYTVEKEFLEQFDKKSVKDKD